MNVLKITSTPIKLSMTSQRARLESRLPDPEVGIIRNPGKLNMKSDHIKVDIDTSRSRDSLGFKTARGLMKDAASAGLKAASDATAQYSRVGNQMMQIQDGVTVSGIIKNQMMAQTNVVTGIAFIFPGSPLICPLTLRLPSLRLILRCRSRRPGMCRASSA